MPDHPAACVDPLAVGVGQEREGVNRLEGSQRHLELARRVPERDRLRLKNSVDVKTDDADVQRRTDVGVADDDAAAVAVGTDAIVADVVHLEGIS